MDVEPITKTKSSFYRRLLVAKLIDKGINTVPAIMADTGMPRRTAQDTISALQELDVQCVFEGANKDGCYVITDWGPVNKKWVSQQLPHIYTTLGYPIV